MKERKLAIIVFMIFALITTLASCSKRSKPAKQKIPIISDTAIQLTIDQIKNDSLVNDAAINVEDDKIKIIIMANKAINEEKAKDLGDSAVRGLGSHATMANDELNGPSKYSYGDLYDFYDVEIGVYPSYETDPNQYIVYGLKSTTANKIRW